MTRITLTDRFIGSDRRKPVSGRADHRDSLVPGMALRVTQTGHKSFVLVARYPLNPKNPTRRALGDYGEITLDQARDKAREWLAMIKKGIDPKTEESRKRADAIRQQTNTFAVMAAAFIERHTSKLAKAADARHVIETEFVKRWGARPATEILPEECAAAIRAIVNRGSPYQAHNSFGYLRRLFNWAIGTHEFGILESPVERLSPKDLIGKREARERILTDAELESVWKATGGRIDAAVLAESRRRDRSADKTAPMSYPYGPLFRMLILTGQRECEVADMTWSEVDFVAKLWTIPTSRMKGQRTHQVPLAEDALALLNSMPRFTVGDHVFTTTGGAKPVNGFSKAKVRLDKLSGVTGWKFHDLRRTMRTHLSALPVQDVVRELVIAHAKKGLHKVYDLHAYRDEKRECLTLWEARLRGIVGVLDSARGAA
jgi:integrase